MRSRTEAKPGVSRLSSFQTVFTERLEFYNKKGSLGYEIILDREIRIVAIYVVGHNLTCSAPIRQNNSVDSFVSVR